MTFNLDIAARTCWMEARGEPEDGQRAVAHVLVNRMNDGRWGKTLAAVCLAPYQFSSWLPKDPNLKAMAALPDEDPLLIKLKGFVQSALLGDPDPTEGATHYYANWIAAPKWVQGSTNCGTFGKQLFFKNVK